MNILITGAFGFVGTNLSKALSTAFKHHLIAVDVSEPLQHNYSEYYTWDELHTIGKKKIDAIIHLAGKAHDTRNTAAEQKYFDINLGLTRHSEPKTLNPIAIGSELCQIIVPEFLYF